MNKNALIILLIFLIVYLIYKITNNSCDGFSDDGNQECSGYPSGGCLPPCEWNDSTNECEQRISKIPLKPKNPSQFLEDIKQTYRDPNSNGVFISMLLPSGQMDASGSVLHKNYYYDILGMECTFGFIWNIDWLEGGLVECLFGSRANTAYFDDYDCDRSLKNNNFCELAHTSDDNKPDRCSHGLFNLSTAVPPWPTNCKQKIKYNLKKNSREPLQDKNCFTYINDMVSAKKTYRAGNNEGVFLKDSYSGIADLNTGFKELQKSNKPLPAALVFYTNDRYDSKCINIGHYKKGLDIINSYFTSDTIVIIINISNNDSDSVLEFVKHKTLGEMPKYVDPD